MTPGKRIRERRKKLKISQQTLAEKLNVNQTQISNYEIDKSVIPSDKLLLLCEILEMKPNYILLGEKEEKWQPKEEEKELLILYSKLSERGKIKLEGIAEQMVREENEEIKEETMNQIS